MVILTACRTGEAIGATWPEVDEEARLWCIPGARMKKAGRDHKVPLSGATTALLAGLPRHRAKLFGGSNMAMAMLLRRMGRGDLTVHGFRSTFATCCKDIGVAAELREMGRRMPRATKWLQPTRPGPKSSIAGASWPSDGRGFGNPRSNSQPRSSCSRAVVSPRTIRCRRVRE